MKLYMCLGPVYCITNSNISISDLGLSAASRNTPKCWEHPNKFAIITLPRDSDTKRHQETIQSKSSVCMHNTHESNELNLILCLQISSGQSGVVCESLTSKIQFVDLAGAEGVRRTGAVGGRLVEGGYINRGLVSELIECIILCRIDL